MPGTGTKGRQGEQYYALWRAYLQPQWRSVLLMAALLLTSVALQLAGPQVVRGYIDGVRAGAAEGALIRAALLFLLVAVAQRVAHVLAGYWSERVAWTATNALRADLAAHLLRLDLGFHKARTPGELIERVDGDVNALAGFFSTFVVELVGSALLLVGILAAVAAVDARLGLAFGVFALAALAALWRVRRYAAPHRLADRERSAAFYGYLGEVLSATEDLRSIGAAAYALRRFFEHLRAWLPVRLRAAFWGQALMMAAIVAFAVGDALAYGLGGALYRAQSISLGAVYTLVAYTAMLAAPIETIRTQLQELQRADAGIARVRELLETESRLQDGTEDLPPGPLAVEFRDVRFAYDDATADGGRGTAEGPSAVRRPPSNLALRGVSFTLAPGRVLGLLGRTGSGKTTIGRLLFRLYDAPAGGGRIGGGGGRRARV